MGLRSLRYFINTSKFKMNFRKDINWLRAIAVIGVVLYHFNNQWLPGGFAGVDVFFVISGFLMTKIIFTGLEQNNFSIFKFYVSRVNRIIPALAFLCFILLIIGWFYFPAVDYTALGKQVFYSLLFISNITYWKDTGYFTSTSDEIWLLHTWSLSVEWQFYILYPLFLIVFWKLLSLRKIKVLLLIIALLGFVFCIISTYMSPETAFYMLPMRAWEMIFGGLAYLYPFNLKQKIKVILKWLGLTLITISYFLLSSKYYWPGYLVSLPTLGTFLIIQANQNDSTLIQNTVLQYIGKWSYSIYLWHWPIVVAIYTFSLNQNYKYAGLVLSLFLGYISATYIERIKFMSYEKWRYIFCVKPVYISLTIIVIARLVYLSNGVNLNIRPIASSEQAAFLDEYALKHKKLDDAYWLQCNTYHRFLENNSYDVDPNCITKKKYDGGIFLWGDSHAEALSLGIRTLLKSQGVPFYQKTSSGCKASLVETTTLQGLFKDACDHSNKVAIQAIALNKPKVVVIAQANSHDKTNWNELNEKLHELGVSHVILVGPVPQWSPSLPRVMVKTKNWYHVGNFISDVGLDLDLINLDSQMKLMKYPQGMSYVSLIDQLCRKNNLNLYECRIRAENETELLQVDYGHLSQSGSLFVVETILKKAMGL